MRNIMRWSSNTYIITWDYGVQKGRSERCFKCEYPHKSTGVKIAPQIAPMTCREETPIIFTKLIPTGQILRITWWPHAPLVRVTQDGPDDKIVNPSRKTMTKCHYHAWVADDPGRADHPHHRHTIENEQSRVPPTPAPFSILKRCLVSDVLGWCFSLREDYCPVIFYPLRAW